MQKSYISKCGYVLHKEEVSEETITTLKNELRGRPLVDAKHGFKNTEVSFPVYTETKNKLYIPKMYGISKWGVPTNIKTNYDGESWNQDIVFTGELRSHQEEPANVLYESLVNGNGGGILSLGTGQGKCLAKNTPVLMFDGTIKMVQDVQVGDVLMGDDSTPRRVLSLARGIDEMYDIIPNEGDKYTVNKEHILVLRKTKAPSSSDCEEIVTITVKDYLKQTNIFKQVYKGFKVPIEFPFTAVDFDPYVLGYLLGDTIPSQEYSEEYDYIITGLNIDVVYNKHIPLLYKCNARAIRLQLLAGIFDASGSVSTDGYCFEIIQTSEQLADDIVYVSRSLGFACYKTVQNKGGKQRCYKITIRGNTDVIPSRTGLSARAKQQATDHVLNTGIKVKYVGVDEYYGFMIDGNRRFVLGDFTVTHNTTTCLNVLARLQTKTLVIVNKISLLHQWKEEIATFLPNASIGIIQGQKNVDIIGKDIVLAMLQSLAKIEYPASLFEQFGTLVVDETHNIASKVFSQVLTKLCCKYTIGLTATPQRSDGCEYVFKWFLGDIVYQACAERKGLSPIVTSVIVKSDEYKEITNVNKITGQSTLQFTSMLSELVEMPKRNKLILEIIKHLMHTEKDRRILVLSDRRSHIQTLYELLTKESHVDVPFTFGKFLGAMKIKDLQRSKACQVIFATYQAFGEGVSEKDLNTLLLVTPKKYIGHLQTTKNESGKLEQIVGRIFRKEHTDLAPMIIDIQDNFSVYKNQSRQRMTFYKEHFTQAYFRKYTIDLDAVSFENIRFESMKKATSKQEESTTPAVEYCLLD